MCMGQTVHVLYILSKSHIHCDDAIFFCISPSHTDTNLPWILLYKTSSHTVDTVPLPCIRCASSKCGQVAEREGRDQLRSCFKPQPVSWGYHDYDISLNTRGQMARLFQLVSLSRTQFNTNRCESEWKQGSGEWRWHSHSWYKSINFETLEKHSWWYFHFAHLLDLDSVI